MVRLFVIFLCFFSMSSIAGENAYFGIKTGAHLDSSNTGYSNSLSVFGGKHIYERNGHIVLIEPEMSVPNSGTPFEISNSDVYRQITSYGIFTGYRSDRPFYFKIRAGILRRKITESDNLLELNKDGLAFGAAFGWSSSRFGQYEVGATLVKQDLLNVSIGLIF